MKHIKNRGRGRPRHFITHKAFNAVLVVIGITVWSLLINMWLEPKIISPLQDGRDSVKAKSKLVYAQEIISPLPTDPIIPTATPTPTPVVSQSGEIAEYIRTVFRSDARKAFLLLSCENAKLNPSAVNTAGNSPAGSRDIGVFQINEYWQGVQGKFLFNWKINVEIAHQLYMENGKSFKLWSCGKKLHI